MNQPAERIIPRAVNIAVIRQDGLSWLILTVRRAEVDSHPGAWGLITGTREPGESLPQTAIRELQEELGCVPESLWVTEHLISFYEPDDDSIWHAPLFLAITMQEEFPTSPEIGQIAWKPIPDAAVIIRWHSLRQALLRLEVELATFPYAAWRRLPLS